MKQGGGMFKEWAKNIFCRQIFRLKVNEVSCLPKLSVIVPVYNEKAEYIQRAISSLINQQFQNIEIIIVDDGSDKKETLEFLTKIRQDNIKVLHKKNGGLGSARNYGLAYARGKVIGFLDADDWVEDDFYLELMTLLVQHNSDMACGVLYCNGKKYDKFPCCTLVDAEKKLKLINNGSVCSKIFKKELFNGVNFPEDGIYYEDNPVLLKLLLKASKVSFNNCAKYNYFTNNQSITHNKEKEEKRIKDSVIVLLQIKNWSNGYDEKIRNLIMEVSGRILFRACSYVRDEMYRRQMDNIFTSKQINSFLETKYTLGQRIFSFKNSKDKSHKIMTFFGLHIKIKRKANA